MRHARFLVELAVGAVAILSCWAAVAQVGSLARDELAHVSTDQGAQGQAYLFHRGGMCYALTPRHVLKDSQRDETYARLIVARPGRSPLSAQADRCAYLPDADLALMRVSGLDPGTECGGLFAGQGGIDQTLSSALDGALVTATESGSVERRSMRLSSTRVNDTSHFWVSPTASADEPVSGMSGGIISFQGRAAGFLLAGNVAGNRYEDNWRVLRIDTATLLAGQIFEGRGGAVIDSARCLSSGSQPDASVVAPGMAKEFASAACGAEIIAFSSPPVSNADRPENLIDSDGMSVWRAGDEASVDVRLCGQKARPVHAVTLHASPGCEPTTGVVAEVFVRGHPRGPWTSLGIAGQSADGSITVSSTAPLNAHDIRASIRGAPGCFGRLSAS